MQMGRFERLCRLVVGKCFDRREVLVGFVQGDCRREVDEGFDFLVEECLLDFLKV